MTSERRLAIVTALAEKHAKTHTVSAAAAKKFLVRLGLYNSKGELSPNYGGEAPKKKAKTTAAP